MKITEISKPIIDTLRDKNFVGHFEVIIYHYCKEGKCIDYAKIKGFKPNKDAFKGFEPNKDAFPHNFGYEFGCELQSKINEICFKIISGEIADEDFTFDIKGYIPYLYVHGAEE